MVHRANQRAQVAEAIMQSVQDRLRTVVQLTPRTSEKETMQLAENPFYFLDDDVDLFVTQFKKLLVVQLKYNDLKEERDYILDHLGVPVTVRLTDTGEIMWVCLSW